MCDDGVTRPVFIGEVQAHDGSWFEVTLLTDSGADRTVLTAEVLAALGLAALARPHQLAGVGGLAASVEVSTLIRLMREDASKVTFRGNFAVFTDPAASDMSILGRDLTDLFAVILDKNAPGMGGV